MNALYRGILGGVILALLAAGVAAALLVDPSDEVTAGSPPTTASTGEVPEVPETVSPATSAMARAEASRSLCRDIATGLQEVFAGRVVAGGERLSSAVDTYAGTADPTIVDPARRMLSTAQADDLVGSLQAAYEASTACTRLGYPVKIGEGPVPCDFPPC